MNFDYNEEQQLLADSVRRYLAKSYDFEARRKIVAGEGWSADAWKQFAEIGLTGLPLGTDHGGFGGGAVDLIGVIETFFEEVVVGPFVPLGLAAFALVSGANRSPLLSSVVGGPSRVSF